MFKWMTAIALIGSMAIADAANADKFDRPKFSDEKRVEIERYLADALRKKASFLPTFAAGLGPDMNGDALLPAAGEKPVQSKVRIASDRLSVDLAPEKLAEIVAPDLADVVRPVLCTTLPCGKDRLS